MSAERFPIRRLIADNVAPHTLVARMGMEDIVEDLMMRAYRTGLHNGKIIGKRNAAQPPTTSGEQK